MSQKDAGHLRVVVVPGQQLEGLGVGAGQHVGLLDPAEPVDGRAVEGHPLVEGVLQLRRGDVEPLGGPEHVGEPQLDEADAPLLHGPEHVVPLALHRTSFACRPAVSSAGPLPGAPSGFPAPPVIWDDAPSAPRLAAAQLNTVVGDLSGNVERVLGALAAAGRAGCRLLRHAELAITGYPPEDLLLKPGFVADNVAAPLEDRRRHHRAVRGRRRVRRRRPGGGGLATRQRCAPPAASRASTASASSPLRRVRRAALVPAGRGAAATFRHRRRLGRRLHLRGRWLTMVRWPTPAAPGPTRGEHERLALQPGPAPRAARHAARARRRAVAPSPT